MTERAKLLLIIWALLVATIWVGGPFVREMLLTADEPRIVVPRGKLAEFERVSTELFESAGPAVVYIFTETASTDVLGPSVPRDPKRRRTDLRSSHRASLAIPSDNDPLARREGPNVLDRLE